MIRKLSEVLKDITEIIIIKPMKLKQDVFLEIGQKIKFEIYDQERGKVFVKYKINHVLIYDIKELDQIFTCDSFVLKFTNINDFNEDFFNDNNIKWLGNQGIINLNENLNVIIENIFEDENCLNCIGYKLSIIRKDGNFVISNQFKFYGDYKFINKNNEYFWFKKEPNFDMQENYKNSIFEYINFWK